MTRSKVTLTIKDSGQIKVTPKLAYDIEAGILPEDGSTVHPDAGGLTLAELGQLHEFGGGKIPARMWLRGWFDRHEKETIAKVRRELETQVRTQLFIDEPLDAIAKSVQDGIQRRITGGHIDPPNAPRTLKEKAPETRPLVGVTGTFWRAIKARVRRRKLP